MVTVLNLEVISTNFTPRRSVPKQYVLAEIKHNTYHFVASVYYVFKGFICVEYYTLTRRTKTRM